MPKAVLLIVGVLVAGLLIGNVLSTTGEATRKIVGGGDPSSGTTTTIFPNIKVTTDLDSDVEPAIFNNKIIWTNECCTIFTTQDRGIPLSNIDFCDISLNGKTGGCLAGDTKLRIERARYIFTSVYQNFQPDINGNKIVWTQRYGNDLNIMMCDLSKNGQVGGCLVGDSKTLITTEGLTFFNNPKIHGNIIVWSNSIRSLPGTSEIDKDIFMCDLSKNGQSGGCLSGDSKTQVTSTGPQDFPDVYENIIVWSSWPNYQYDQSSPNNVFMCNILLNGNKGGCLANDEKIQLSYTTSNNWKTTKIYGNNVIWTDDRNGNIDIYMTQI